ncbi:MAG: HEAT repeat domain-containing protein, partial [Armatimonadota bacterium]
MRVRSIAVALLLLASLIGWLVAGCRQSAEQAQTASEEAEHEHEHEAEAELPGETAQPDAEQVAAQAEETLSIKVDYDRSYDPIQLERLRGLLMVGNPEHKQRALAALKDLLKNSRVVSVRQQVAGILGSAPEEALQELADTARNDTDAGVRAVAIESLSHAPASESLMA